MSGSAQSPDSPFWDFTLAVYRREGVAPACIALQDGLGLDVNFLLFCVFAGSRGVALHAEEFARLETCAAPWRQNVIHPMRRARRWLKEQTLLPAPAVDALRCAILAQEIEAEGVQQRLMEAELAIPAAEAEPSARPAAEAEPSARPAGTPSIGTAGGNLASYIAWSGASPDGAGVLGLAVLLSQALAPSSLEDAKAVLQECLARAAPPGRSTRMAAGRPPSTNG